MAGVEHIVSVFDARMARIFRTVDCPYEVIGAPARIGQTMTYAGLFEISGAMRRRLGNKAGLPERVLSQGGFQPQATRLA